MKKIKCTKCALYYRPRKYDELGEKMYQDLCWNCRHICQSIALVSTVFTIDPKLNRTVFIDRDAIQIARQPKGIIQ